MNLGKRPTGTMGEFATMLLFPGARLARKKSHDIRANQTKIEVKSARPRKEDGDWIFNITTSQKRWAPIFAFVCFESGESWKISRFYLIKKEELLGKKTVYIKNNQFAEFRFW